MNIAIDIRSLMEPYRSGVAEYTYNLLNNLLKIDLENQYFLFYNSFSDISQNLPKWNKPNVKFIGFRYPNKIFNLSIKFLKYPKLDQLLFRTLDLKLRNYKIDLFFLPNINFATFSPDCRKAITVHDLSFERYPEFYSWKRRWWHRVINPKKLISNSDQIIAVSENTKNDLIDLYKIPAEKIKVIYSGISQEFQPITNNQKLNQIRQKYNLPNNFIFYLGNLEPRKNIEGLIQAFKILKSDNTPVIPARRIRGKNPEIYRNVQLTTLRPDPEQTYNLQLVIAGPPSWSYHSIYRLAYQSKFKNQIRFIGYVDSEDKPYLYNLAKLFVYPSFYEGFGLPLLEAMACGTPVITSFTSSLGEIVGQGGLLVDPYNPQEIAEAVYQILTDEKLKNNLIENGQKQVKKFSWEKCAEETLKFFIP